VEAGRTVAVDVGKISLEVKIWNGRQHTLPAVFFLRLWRSKRVTILGFGLPRRGLNGELLSPPPVAGMSLVTWTEASPRKSVSELPHSTKAEGRDATKLLVKISS